MSSVAVLQIEDSDSKFGYITMFGDTYSNLFVQVWTSGVLFSW